MSNKDEQLVRLIEDIKQGKAEKKELCRRLYRGVYALVYPVIRDDEDSKNVAKKALIKICSNIDSIDTQKNVDRQIATLVSAYLLNLLISRHGEKLKDNISENDYPYEHIRDDQQLYKIIRKNAAAFRNPKAFDTADACFKALPDIHMAVIELYAYEMHSIEEVEEITDVDSSFLTGWIAGAKSFMLDFVSESEASSDGQQEVYEGRERGEDHEEGSGFASNMIRFFAKENPVTLFVKKLFPALTFPIRAAIIYAGGSIVVLLLVVVVIVMASSGKPKTKPAGNGNVNQQQTSVSPTQVQPSTAPDEISTPSTQEVTDEEASTPAATTNTRPANVRPTQARTKAPTQAPEEVPAEVPNEPQETPTQESTEPQTEAPTQESTESSGTPEQTQTGAPEQTQTAAPEQTQTGAPEQTQTAAPEQTQTAAPEQTQTAAPEQTQTAAPKQPQTEAPAADTTN